MPLAEQMIQGRCQPRVKGLCAIKATVLALEVVAEMNGVGIAAEGV